MTQYRVDLALLAVAAVWGSSYLATKAAVEQDGVFAFLTLRFAVATGLLVAVLGSRLRRIGRAELTTGIRLGAILSIVCVCETYGVTMTSASNAGLIMALTIVLTPLLARGGAAPLFYAPAAVVVLGCVALTQSGGFAAPGRGDALIAGAAVLRAIHINVMSRRSAHLDPAVVTVVQLATVAVLASAPAGILGQFGTISRMTTEQWWLTGYLALACTVFAFGLQMWAARRSTGARIALLLGTEPLWALLIGIGLAAEPVTVIGMVGATMILVGSHWGRLVDARFGRERETAPHRIGAGP